MQEELGIKEIVELVREVNDANGWGWEDEDNENHSIRDCEFLIPAKHGLIHTEVSELESAERKKHLDNIYEESADIIIRAIDLSSQLHLLMDTTNGMNHNTRSCFKNMTNRSHITDAMRKYYESTYAPDKYSSLEDILEFYTLEKQIQVIRYEIDEALEKYRNGSPWYQFYVVRIIKRVLQYITLYWRHNNMSPDYAGFYTAIIDKIEKNRRRDYKHGKKA